MILNEDSYNKLINTTRLIIVCDDCGKQLERTYRNVKKGRKMWNNKDYCSSCVAKKTAVKKPQCNKEYWEDEGIKKKHSETIKSSEKYRASCLVRSERMKGPGNHRYGKKVSLESRAKMSKSRIGKVGVNATAWKGGKKSLTSRVKKILHTRYNWYKRVYIRDGFKCVECGSNKNLDAHHIKPIVKIIKELLANTNYIFKSEEEKLEWLVNQQEIKDINLDNGVTLCRNCHKKAHKNWGSKISP